jgi:hypothetical protein
MIKKSLLTTLSAVVLFGCASDAHSAQKVAPQASSVAPPADALGAAFFGLSLKDCYASAADCAHGVTDPHTWASAIADCRTQLHGCFGDLVEEALTAVEQGVTEIAQCGQEGLSCYGDAHDVEAVVACHQHVEGCVDGKVEDLTGIELPTTKEILDTAVETAHTVSAVPAEAAESTADTAVTVTDIAGDAIGDTLDGAAQIAGGVASSAESLLDCAVQGHECMWDSADFIACSDAYQACVEAIP